MVDNITSSIRYDFNTGLHRLYLICDIKAISIILEASLQLRIIVMQLLLERNDEKNGQLIDDMYSNMTHKISEYNEFVWEIAQHAPANIIVSINDEYEWFCARAKQWLHLAKIINAKNLNKKHSQNSKKYIVCCVVSLVITIVIVISILVVHFANK